MLQLERELQELPLALSQLHLALPQRLCLLCTLQLPLALSQLALPLRQGSVKLVALCRKAPPLGRQLFTQPCICCHFSLAPLQALWQQPATLCQLQTVTHKAGRW